MEDNNQGSTSPDESARPPKKQKRVVLPKNKRRFTAVIRTKNPSSTNAGEDKEPQAAAAPTSVTDRVISKRASRPPSVAELNAEIKRMHQQLQDAISQQSSLQRENESLKKRNKALSEVVEKARSDLRDHRKQNHASDKSNKQQIRASIISEEHNAESVTASILVAFQRSGKLLDQWRAVTQEMYPDHPDLLDGIPTSNDLSLTKLAKGFTMTDTCNTARKIQQLLKDEISNVCKERVSLMKKSRFIRATAGSIFAMSGSVQLKLH